MVKFWLKLPSHHFEFADRSSADAQCRAAFAVHDAVGCSAATRLLAGPEYPVPVRSVFEQSKHDWVQIDGAVERFQRSSVAKIQTDALPKFAAGLFGRLQAG